MAQVVVKTNEVYLGDTLFPIIGKVRVQQLNRFPGKIVTGDYEYANEQILSNLISNDLRGGLLIEEMDERVDINRSYWGSTNIRFRGHETLPRLVTLATNPTNAPTAPSITDGNLELWDSPTALTNWTETGTSTLNRSAASPNQGTYHASFNNSSGTLYQDIDTTNDYAGIACVFRAYVKSDNASEARIGISDGATTTYSSYHTGGGSYEQLTATATLGIVTDKIRLILDYNSQSGTAFYDGPMTFTITPPTVGNPGPGIMFNNILYYAFGRILAKENSAGTGFDYLAYLPATITDLTRSVGNNLYIFMGDAQAYVYMNTSEVFVLTNVASANLGIHWDGKLWKMDTAGLISHAATPNSATPSWTSNGTLADAGLLANDVKSLLVSRDADGSPIIYAGTKKGYWAHDTGNAVWLETEVSFPDHPNGGAGLVRWRDATFISNGLEVLKYIAAAYATITPMGLDRDDGLPAQYAGEIVSFIGANNEFFALVDSSGESGTNYSTVMSYDGKGWQVEWVAATANDVMSHGVVANDKAYRLYFNHDNKVYWMPIEKNIRNPKKISTHTYAASAISIRPWFDAGTHVFTKVAKKITLSCNDMTAEETITVKYRLDHTATDVDTGWTTLGSAVTEDGKVELVFGTDGAGILFDAIQFRFDFARSSTTTLSPDLLAAVLSYMKVTDLKWQWSFIVNCSLEHKGEKPKQLWESLEAVANANLFQKFVYRNDSTGGQTHYVKVHPLTGQSATGNDYGGTYNVTVVEP